MDSSGYTRLPSGPRFQLAFVNPERSALYLGANHVMHITHSFLSVNARHYELGDIQGIVVRETPSARIFSIAWGAYAAFVAFWGVLAVAVVGWSLDSWYGFGPALAVGLIALAVNLSRGPTCETHLITAVQSVKLTGVNRVRHAAKLVEALRPFIEGVQGAPLGDDAGDRIAGVVRHADAPTGLLADRYSRHRFGIGTQVHWAIVGLLMYDVVMCLIDFISTDLTTQLLSLIWLIGVPLLAFIALIRQHTSDMPNALKLWTWAVLIQHGLFFGGMILITTFYMIATIDAGGDAPAWLGTTDIPTPLLMFINPLNIMLDLAFAAIGALLLRVYDRRKRMERIAVAIGSASGA